LSGKLNQVVLKFINGKDDSGLFSLARKEERERYVREEQKKVEERLSVVAGGIDVLIKETKNIWLNRPPLEKDPDRQKCYLHFQRECRDANLSIPFVPLTRKECEAIARQRRGNNQLPPRRFETIDHYHRTTITPNATDALYDVQMQKKAQFDKFYADYQSGRYLTDRKLMFQIPLPVVKNDRGFNKEIIDGVAIDSIGDIRPYAQLKKDFDRVFHTRHNHQVPNFIMQYALKVHLAGKKCDVVRRQRRWYVLPPGG